MPAPDSRQIHIRRDSEQWLELVRWTEAMLASYRAKLESESVSLHEVPALRGKIALLKQIQRANDEEIRE